ncbi:MAG: hypothetical protein RI894_840 [Bacteroidota bacterium]|jgi:hypothetical protein
MKDLIIDENAGKYTKTFLVPFKICISAETAENMAALLRENNVACRIEYPNTHFSPVNYGDASTGVYRLMLANESDFLRAENALLTIKEAEIAALPADYYLLKFSDEQLYQVLIESDDWGEFDQALAATLLEKRDVAIDADKISTAKAARKNAMQQDRISKATLALGFLLALMGNPISLAMMIAYSVSKKKTGNGVSFYRYDDFTRTTVLWIGVVWLIMVFVIYFIMYK